MIPLTPEDHAEIAAYFQTNPHELMQIPAVRAIVGRRRYAKLKQIFTPRTADLQHVRPDTMECTVAAQAEFSAVARVDRLTKPLLAIDRVFFGAGSMSALCVGPRTEMELFALMGIGFKTVRGLDLISYSPLIDIGNMHAMPYPNSSFDVVLAGWVLVYSDDPWMACREIARVCKPGGIIAIGATYWPPEKQKAEGNGRGPEAYPNVEQVLDHFNSSRVFTAHDSPDPLVEGRTIVIFENNK